MQGPRTDQGKVLFASIEAVLTLGECQEIWTMSFLRFFFYEQKWIVGVEDQKCKKVGLILLML